MAASHVNIKEKEYFGLYTDGDGLVKLKGGRGGRREARGRERVGGRGGGREGSIVIQISQSKFRLFF